MSTTYPGLSRTVGHVLDDVVQQDRRLRVPDSQVSVDGEHFHVGGFEAIPKSVQQPSPPEMTITLET